MRCLIGGRWRRLLMEGAGKAEKGKGEVRRIFSYYLTYKRAGRGQYVWLKVTSTVVRQHLAKIERVIGNVNRAVFVCNLSRRLTNKRRPGAEDTTPPQFGTGTRISESAKAMISVLPLERAKRRIQTPVQGEERRLHRHTPPLLRGESR